MRQGGLIPAMLLSVAQQAPLIIGTTGMVFYCGHSPPPLTAPETKGPLWRYCSLPEASAPALYLITSIAVTPPNERNEDWRCFCSTNETSQYVGNPVTAHTLTTVTQVLLRDFPSDSYTILLTWTPPPNRCFARFCTRLEVCRFWTGGASRRPRWTARAAERF